MSRICLYLDEDTIKSALVKALRNADLDVITVADAGMLGYADEEQLIWSTIDRIAQVSCCSICRRDDRSISISEFLFEKLVD